MSNIESGATLFTHEEIELYKSTPYYPIIQKLYDLMLNPNPAYTPIIISFAERIADVDAEVAEDKLVGITYYKKKNCYTAERSVNGVRHFIKKSPSKQEVIKALLEFCTLHNVSPYYRSDNRRRKNSRKK